MRIALDTNVLAYAEGVDGAERQVATLGVLADLPSERIVVPVQVLGEFFHVLLRKKRSPEAARAAVAAWRDSCETFETSAETLSRGLDLAVDHRLGTWDAVILAAASGAGCRILLSEDMQDGFTWGGVTVVNPFVTVPHPLLLAALTARR